jgi:ATP-binding cassette subfamily B multidrug efflux pump
MSVYDVEELEQHYERFDGKKLVRMLSYLKPHRAKLTLDLGLMLVVTAINLFEPVLVMFIIDNAIKNFNLPLLYQTVALLLFLRVLMWQVNKLHTRLLNKTGQQVLYEMRKELFDHIQLLSFDFYDGRPVGKIMARVTNDVNAIGEFVNGSVIQLFTQALSLLGIIVIMLSMHWKLALLCFSLLPFLGTFFMYIEQKMERGWLQVRRQDSAINAHLNETITGMQVIQLFSRQKLNAQKFLQLVNKRIEEYLGVCKVEFFFWPVLELLGAIGTGLVLWYGAREFMAGMLTVGVIWAFLQYLEKFWQPLSAFSAIYSQMLSAMASSHRVFEFLDTKPQVVDAPNAIAMPEIVGRVEFENVSFGYQDGQTVLDNVSFCVEPGQTVALVGPTGAGKSTIINLLTRFYDPTCGSVQVDGYDLREVQLQSYRSQLGIVLQDTFIFSGTIKENIEYGRLGAEMEEIMAAAKAVNAHDFIMGSSDGYETKTEERGGTLSTGQRQLLAFARALLADPRILILDEATSSIDTETEQLIQKAMERLLQGRTAFIIAHRLSTIRNADVICVIDSGRIAEQGSHAQLMQRRGKYFELYTKQHQHLTDIISAG